MHSPVCENTHSIPCRFRSAASSRCLCSMATFSFVASENSLLTRLLVTFSQSFRLSRGCCLSSDRTDLGSTSREPRSISGVQSSADVPPMSALEYDAAGMLGVGSFTWDGLGEEDVERVTPPWSTAGYDPVPTRFHLTLPRHDPSKTATMRSLGTCFTFVHSSQWLVSDSYTMCTTPSTKKCARPSQDYGLSLDFGFQRKDFISLLLYIR